MDEIRDLQSREDIRLLIDTFYGRVKRDEVIGYIFNDIAKVDWPHHLPVMYDFWEGVLFQKGGFKGNPMTTHQRLNQLAPLTKEHFVRWVALFNTTVDQLFSGLHAETAKQRAQSIATLIQVRLATA
jgi:hemoglobin